MFSVIIASLVLVAFAADPPTTWQEHWQGLITPPAPGHNQALRRVFFNNDLAVYFDNDVNSSITWPNTYLTSVWQYTKQTYGAFGPDSRLFAVFHGSKYCCGGHATMYFEPSHDYRNTIDVSWPWTLAGTGIELDIVTHEVSHIVEIASKGYFGSPARAIWGDSKWAEIFIYDVYKNLGRTADAQRWYDSMMLSTGDTYPRPGTLWFKNWFYPIYSMNGAHTINGGGKATLNNYFTLLAQYFPKYGNNVVVGVENGTVSGNVSYAGSLNLCEFVWFWSGAVGTNLKQLATDAFGWTTECENQFNAAKIKFPNICIDTETPSACDGWKTAGYCAPSSQYFSYMSAVCKRSCNLCSYCSSSSISKVYDTRGSISDSGNGATVTYTCSFPTLPSACPNAPCTGIWFKNAAGATIGTKTTFPAGTTTKTLSATCINGALQYPDTNGTYVPISQVVCGP